jgi:hypothetical protein
MRYIASLYKISMVYPNTNIIILIRLSIRHTDKAKIGPIIGQSLAFYKVSFVLFFARVYSCLLTYKTVLYLYGLKNEYRLKEIVVPSWHLQ